jgi:hypothetical protein
VSIPRRPISLRRKLAIRAELHHFMVMLELFSRVPRPKQLETVLGCTSKTGHEPVLIDVVMPPLRDAQSIPLLEAER